MGVVEVKKEKKYEYIPPDGGWGYLIGVAVIINLMAISSFVPCFGMIFKHLLPQLGMDSTSVTLMNGMAAFNIAITGMFTSSMLKYLTIRQLGLIATLVYNLGIFCTVFVDTKIAFFFCTGVLQGFGNGLIFNLSCTMLNNYFVKRRFLAVSFTQTVVGLTALISPQFVKWALESYGLRGTLLLISGVSMQSVVAMALMQPVAWHMIRVEVPEDKENDQHNAEMKSLLNEGEEMKKEINTNEKDENLKEEIQKHSSIKEFILKVINISVLKSFLLSNASIGVAFSVSCDFTFTIMLPQALYSMGWSENNVAWALSLSAMGDLVTRAAFIFMSNWLRRIGSHEIYICGLVLSLVSRLGMLCTRNMLVMTTFITIMGISRCTIAILIPLVVADSVGEENFSAAMGILMMLFGILNLSMAPIVGAIRDLTDSYSTALYTLTACFGIISVFWTLELIFKRKKNRKTSCTTA